MSIFTCHVEQSHEPAHEGAPLALTVKRAAIANLVAELTGSSPTLFPFNRLCAYAICTTSTTRSLAGCCASGQPGGDDRKGCLRHLVKLAEFP